MISKERIAQELKIQQGYSDVDKKYKGLSVVVYCYPNLKDDELFFVDYSFFLLNYKDENAKFLGEYAKSFLNKIVNKIKAKKYKIYYKISIKSKIVPTDDSTKGVKIVISIYFERKNETK